MMPRPLANCWFLAARWNVNGSTCDCKPHRKATELTATSVYLGHNMSICMFAGTHQCEATPAHVSFNHLNAFFFFSLFIFVYVAGAVSGVFLGVHVLKMKVWWCRPICSTGRRMGESQPYLREVTNKVATFAVVLGEDVEKEGLHIVVEGLVVEEQLGQQTQVLTVDCAHVPINLL